MLVHLLKKRKGRRKNIPKAQDASASQASLHGGGGGSGGNV